MLTPTTHWTPEELTRVKSLERDARRHAWYAAIGRELFAWVGAAVAVAAVAVLVYVLFLVEY